MKMTRVEILDVGKVSGLQVSINEFLETMESDTSFELIDIKYNTYAYGEDRIDYYSAMVIYKIS